jgi:hypothetical protein
MAWRDDARTGASARPESQIPIPSVGIPIRRSGRLGSVSRKAGSIASCPKGSWRPMRLSGGLPRARWSGSRSPRRRPMSTPSLSYAWGGGLDGPACPADCGWADLREFDGDARLGAPEGAGACAGAVAARSGHCGDAGGQRGAWPGARPYRCRRGCVANGGARRGCMSCSW